MLREKHADGGGVGWQGWYSVHARELSPGDVSRIFRRRCSECSLFQPWRTHPSPRPLARARVRPGSGDANEPQARIEMPAR